MNEQNPEHRAPVRPPAALDPPTEGGLIPCADPLGAAPGAAISSGAARTGNAVSSELRLSEADPETPTMLALIDRYVRDPTVDVDKLERILAMRREMEAREAELAFNEAKSRVLERLAGIKIVKNRSVLYDSVKGQPEKGRSEAFKYAPLEEIDRHLAPLLAAEKMDLSYSDEPRDSGRIMVRGRLKHLPCGHYEDSFMEAPLDSSGGKNNIQAVGSTNSYLRRYIACNIFNIVVVGDDDDGTGGTIDEAQAKHIRGLLMKAVMFDPNKRSAQEYEASFLKFARAPAVEQIPYRLYLRCVSTLQDQIPKEE